MRANITSHDATGRVAAASGDATGIPRLPGEDCSVGCGDEAGLFLDFVAQGIGFEDADAGADV